MARASCVMFHTYRNVSTWLRRFCLQLDVIQSSVLVSNAFSGRLDVQL